MKSRTASALAICFLCALTACAPVTPRDSSGLASYVDPRAFGRTINNRNEAVLVLDGKEYVMKSTEITNPEKGVYGLSFINFSLSPSGRYALFTGLGWEWAQGFVYDTHQHKIILELDSPMDFRFTPDEESLFACAVDHFRGELYGRVYSMPEAMVYFSYFDQEQIKETLKTYDFVEDISCIYRPEEGAIEFIAKFRQGLMEGQPTQEIKIMVDAQAVGPT